MRSTALVLAVAAVSAGDGVRAAYFPRAVAGDGFVTVPVGRRQRTDKMKRDDGSVLMPLANEDAFYAAEISLGTPPQSVIVLVDTGSSELWVDPECSTAPDLDEEKLCEEFGKYDPSKSTTPPLGPLGSEEINYGDPSDKSTETSVDIDYYVDVVGFGGSSNVNNQTFGVVSQSQGQSQGILGLAPDLTAGFTGQAPYPLLLDSMASQGTIASRAFSLALGHADTSQGSVVFGGVDKNKFIGSLVQLPIVPGVGGEARLAVNMKSIGLTDASGAAKAYDLNAEDTNVMLDSGTSISRMHSAAVTPLLEALDAEVDSQGNYLTSCSQRQVGGSVDFGFAGVTVRIPFSDFIIDAGSPSACYIGVTVTTDQQILGDSVLRGGYFVFDWDNQAIHVAEGADCGDGDIAVIGSGSDAVPSVTGNCPSSDAQFTGGILSASASLSGSALPTKAYTTVYTVTSCPSFDVGCQTGEVETQTVGPAASTTTVTASPGSDSGKGSAGLRADVWMSVMFVFGSLVALHH